MAIEQIQNEVNGVAMRIYNLSEYIRQVPLNKQMNEEMVVFVMKTLEELVNDCACINHDLNKEKK